MKRLPLIIFSLLSMLTAVIAQDTTKSKTTTQINTEITSYPTDPSAHAFALTEQGEARVLYDADGRMRMYYYYHTLIRIVDEAGLKYGTIEIPLYGTEQVYDIKGATTNKDNNGKNSKTDLATTEIYTVQENKYQKVIKFALPALKPGCLIEYSYAISSPYFESFHNWQFEGKIPKMHSEFQARIPLFLSYNVILTGALTPTTNKSGLLAHYFTTPIGEKFDCKFIGVSMDNVPAFVPEVFMTTPGNFISTLSFNLSEYTSLINGSNHSIAKQWADVDESLKTDEYFGHQLTNKNLLKGRIKPVIEGKTDTMAKAKAIYQYVQKSVKWNGSNSIRCDDISDVLDKHTGDAGDINLTLVAAFNAVGIIAEPVLLSTREHGVINKIYPVITDFNYVIAKVEINGKIYMLDATDPLLGFGMLPLRCLNDQGRLVSVDFFSRWIDITTLQNESLTNLLDLALQENGTLKGTYTIYAKGYAGYKMRKAIKSFNTVDEYIENVDAKLPKVKITKSEITNLDSLDLPLTIVYDLNINTLENQNEDVLSFNPYIFNKITINPFKSEKRIYPVDWGMPSETKFILHLQLPNDYSIENPPGDVSATLPNNGGSFIIKYNGIGNSFTLSSITSFKKSIYQPDEYPHLKELYNKIILSEKAEMIFRKKL